MVKIKFSSFPPAKLKPQGIVPLILSVTLLHAAAASAGPEQKQTEHPILTEEQAATLPQKSTQGGDIPLLTEKNTRTLDELQKKGTALLGSTASWIDSFFSDPRYTEEENRTMARIKLGAAYTRNDDFESVSSIDLRLKLPLLEKRQTSF